MSTILVGKSDSGGAGWAKLPVGMYPATLQSFEKAPSAFDPDKLRFQFNYDLDDEYEDDGETPITMRFWANAILSPKSTMAEIIDAHGFTWKAGEEFDIDTLIDTPVNLVVKRRTPKGKDEEIAYVDSLMPIAVKKQRPAPMASRKEEPVTLDFCCIPKCGKEVNKYDADGNAYGAKHANLIEV